jgi:hypothetical protein
VFAGVRLSGRLGVLALIAVSIPASAQTEPQGSPTLSVSDKLDDRRYVTTGDRAYIVGTEAGCYPAMGFHTRGEMGDIWSPPIKLLDGIWFGIGDQWIGPATEFTSGYGHAKMKLPGQGGLSVSRTDFVPDGNRAVLVGLTFEAGAADQNFTLKMDAHSELMGAYPWGETNPSQTAFNLEDTVAAEDDNLIFREQGTPPAENALSHDWAAVVGSNLTPTGSETGDNFRGPQDPAVICPASGPNTPSAPPRCDDTAYGEGKGGQLRYDVTIPANTTETVWFAVAGADFDGENQADAKAEALAEHEAVLADPEALLRRKISDRLALQENTKLSLPGNERLKESIDWSKQNLADSVQVAEDLEIRETNAGKNYPAPEGELAQMRFLGAGFPDYQWLFGTDGEYTAFASVGVGQFEPIKDHLRALKEVSLIDNGDSGKVVHEVVTDGAVYFGSNVDPGNTDETAKFPSAVAVIWRWTGDDEFLEEMYGFSKANMEYIFRELDEDNDGWPEGLGNVERNGMGEEKLDNTVYTIRGLYDLADMARSMDDPATARWATEKADGMKRRFEGSWWFGREGVTQYADSLRNPGNEKVFQRHWIGATPMEVELTNAQDQAVPGLAVPGHGRLGENQQQHYTDANADLQLSPDEQPGAMPEIVPSPDYGRSINRPFNERAMVLQAWGAYGTIWPVVHQHLGVRPDMGRGELEVVPQLPPRTPDISGENIRLGDGSVTVFAKVEGSAYTTRVEPAVALDELVVGHTVPRDARILSVTLNGAPVDDYLVRETNRGQEILIQAATSGEQTLVVTTA